MIDFSVFDPQGGSMRCIHALAVWGTVLAIVSCAPRALADPARPPLDVAGLRESLKPGVGIAVVSDSEATDAAWPLAQAVYASSMRPATLDEAGARVLAGEPPPADASRETRELAETIAAIHGEDAASRTLLDSLARRFHVRALVVVRRGTNGGPTARVYVADAAAFDAATYSPDSGATFAWSAAVRSLEHAYGASSPGTLRATSTPQGQDSGANGAAPSLLRSWWFWVAIGAAAAAAGAFYVLERDSGSASSIQLHVQVPH